MDERLSPTRMISRMVGIVAALGLVYAHWWPRAAFGGALWPPSEWQTGDSFRAVSLLVLAILGVVLYRLALPLKRDPLQRAQQRVVRTKRIVLLLIVVVLFLAFAAASPSYHRGFYAVLSTSQAQPSDQ